jgi:hypothetical protein
MHGSSAPGRWSARVLREVLGREHEAVGWVEPHADGVAAAAALLTKHGVEAMPAVEVDDVLVATSTERDVTRGQFAAAGSVPGRNQSSSNRR